MLGWMQPEMNYVVDEEGVPFIKGDIIVRTEVGYPNRIPTEIHFPDDYPEDEPWAIQTPARFEHVADRHFYPSGRCCLWLPVASPWRARDQYAFRHFLDQLTVFCHRQLVMDANPGSPFPGEQWDHGGLGYLTYMLREWGPRPRMLRAFLEGVPSRADCPCGSGRRFVQCHEQAVNRFRRRAGSAMTRELINGLRHAEADIAATLTRRPENAIRWATTPLAGVPK